MSESDVLEKIKKFCDGCPVINCEFYPHDEPDQKKDDDSDENSGNNEKMLEDMIYMNVLLHSLSRVIFYVVTGKMIPVRGLSYASAVEDAADVILEHWQF